jgi:hypothetical protein
MGWEKWRHCTGVFDASSLLVLWFRVLSFLLFSTFLLRDKEEKILLEATHARKRT